ncbi:hypothetical protein ACLOJK_041526, partial [Asimina triloba]
MGGLGLDPGGPGGYDGGLGLKTGDGGGFSMGEIGVVDEEGGGGGVAYVTGLGIVTDGGRG